MYLVVVEVVIKTIMIVTVQKESIMCQALLIALQ